MITLWMQLVYSSVFLSPDGFIWRTPGMQLDYAGIWICCKKIGD